MGRKKILNKEQVLAAIRRWLVEHGVPPTVEELRKVLRLGSTRTVLRYLRWLEKDGDIERWAGARGLKLLRAHHKGLETMPIPLVGEVSAGPLMVAEENVEAWLRLPKSTLKPSTGRFFLLRIRGDSMNKATVNGSRIQNGDLVLVRQQSVAQPGEIVVALIDGEATIKRLERGPNYFILRPQSTNPEHQPVIVDREFEVAGVVCGIFKKGSDLFLSQN
jgi:repressor LexA